MAKIFTLLKTKERHFDLSEFLVSKGYEHHQSWQYPPILPFGSCPLMEKYINEACDGIPDICIFDLNLRSDITGEEALKCIQRMDIFTLSMPVIYLLNQGQTFTLNNKTSNIYWEQYDSLNERVKEDIFLVITEILRPKTNFFDKVIDSI
jgi:hypothetical protein